MTSPSQPSSARLRDDWMQPAAERFAPDAAGFDASMQSHDEAVQRGQDGYIEPRSGLFVMTAVTLAARPCCGNNCRHCPWETKT